MALLSTLSAIVLFSLSSAYLYLLARARSDKLANGPQKLPGPRGLPLPFIGSLHELSFKNNWMKFHEWGEKYGSIYQTNLAGVNHIWITREAVACEILTKRASITADRPHLPSIDHDNRTSGHYLPLLSRNEVWVRQRKFSKQFMDMSQQASFYGYCELETIRMLMELLHNPSRYHESLESFTARVTSRLAWGTARAAVELQQRARELLFSVSPTGAVGNHFPFLHRLPEKLFPPKAWERRRARTERQFFETMQKDVQSSLSETGPLVHLAKPGRSWMQMFLENRAFWGFSSDLEGAYAVGMNGIAGALTAGAIMQSFVLALLHHPQHHQILHEEIDRVVGDRLPVLGDMPNMPVLRAFIRETQRWRPAVPLGIPHEATEDIVYEGYLIPKGSSIHGLEWSTGRDPVQYPDPEAWNPHRWLDPAFPTYREPLTTFPRLTGYGQFGYGHRVCTGQPLVEAEVFLACASVAWLFSVESVDESALAAAVDTGAVTPPPEGEIERHLGQESTPAFSRPRSEAVREVSAKGKGYGSDPTMDYSTLLIAKPMPFEVKLDVRRKARAELIARLWVEKKCEGEYEDSRVYWKDEQGKLCNEGNAECGWGPVCA